MCIHLVIVFVVETAGGLIPLLRDYLIGDVSLLVELLLLALAVLLHRITLRALLVGRVYSYFTALEPHQLARLLLSRHKRHRSLIRFRLVDPGQCQVLQVAVDG